MRSEDAESIVREYAATVARAFQDGSVAPASALPYDREVIRRAILDCATARHAAGTLDGSARDALISAYVHLATFVDDEVAKEALDVNTLMLESPERALLDAALPMKLARASEIEADVSQKMRELATEFRWFEMGLGIRQTARAAAEEAAEEGEDPGTNGDADTEVLVRRPWWRFWGN